MESKPPVNFGGERQAHTIRAVAPVRFRVHELVARGSGLDGRAEWLAWPPDCSRLHGDPSTLNLPSILRRRVSAIGQEAFRASLALSEAPDVRFVFCSRYGELDRTLRILGSLSTREPVSPADFSLSVHNALVGLLSIARNNRAGHTAISAGADTFGYGVLEGATSLNDGSSEATMVVYFDEGVASPYNEVADATETAVALAMLLRAPQGDSGDFLLTREPRDQYATPQPATAQPLDFMKFMMSGAREMTSVGERAQWRWQRCD